MFTSDPCLVPFPCAAWIVSVLRGCSVVDQRLTMRFIISPMAFRFASPV